MFVTVLRHEPPPIVGMCGTIHDRAYMAFEAVLDWLETTGVLVERFELDRNRHVLAKRAGLNQVLAAEGIRALPLIAVDDTIVSRGSYVSRAQLARLIGAYRRAAPVVAPRSPIAQVTTASAA